MPHLGAVEPQQNVLGAAGIYFVSCSATEDLHLLWTESGVGIPLPPTPSAGLEFASSPQPSSPSSMIVISLEYKDSNPKLKQHVYEETQ